LRVIGWVEIIRPKVILSELIQGVLVLCGAQISPTRFTITFYNYQGKPIMELYEEQLETIE
jgi:hypothetical protein